MRLLREFQKVVTRYIFFSGLFVLIFYSLTLDSSALELEEAKFIFETNDTASDIGVQLFFDGEPWDKMKFFSPDGNLLFSFRANNVFKDLGDTELFFESEEPVFRVVDGEDPDITVEEIFEMFPEGDYELEGTTVEGEKLEGTAYLSHIVPCGPVVLFPVPENGEIPETDADDTVIIWSIADEDVNRVIDPDPEGDCIASDDVDIIAYEVIVEHENGLLKVFDIILPGDSDRIMVPEEFLDPGTMYKFEVLAIQNNDGAYGNQTITEGEFETSAP